MKSYTIGQFNEYFSPIMDAASITVKNYVYWLNRKVGKTYMVTPSYPGYTDHENFPVIRYTSIPVPMMHPYRIGIPWLDSGLQKKLRKIPFNLVHCHTPFSAGQHALKLARSRGIPVIASFHSNYREAFQKIFHPLIVKKMTENMVDFYSSVDEVWVYQPSEKETLREYGYKGFVKMVNNGIDFDRTDEIALMRHKIRKSLCLEDSDPLFLFVGQLNIQKNLPLIIESLSELRDVNFTAFFIGEGCDATKLRLLTGRYGIAEKVHFTGSICDRKKIQEYYAAADLLLCPSFSENIPLVVSEAAAMHTPSLMIRDSVSSGIIRDNVTGFLTPGHKEAIVGKMKSLIANPALLKSVGENASQEIFRPWEEAIDEVKERYLNIIEYKNWELAEKKCIMPWTEKVWPEPVFEANTNMAKSVVPMPVSKVEAQ